MVSPISKLLDDAVLRSVESELRRAFDEESISLRVDAECTAFGNDQVRFSIQVVVRADLYSDRIGGPILGFARSYPSVSKIDFRIGLREIEACGGVEIGALMRIAMHYTRELLGRRSKYDDGGREGLERETIELGKIAKAEARRIESATARRAIELAEEKLKRDILIAAGVRRGGISVSDESVRRREKEEIRKLAETLRQQPKKAAEPPSPPAVGRKFDLDDE